MIAKHTFSLSLALTLAWSLPCCSRAGEEAPKKPAMSESKPEVVKSDDEWMKKLTQDQFYVTRKRGTERPFGQTYEEFNKQGEGTYYCVCCGAELFTSGEKFHSGCGWPSFYDQSKAKNVLERPDESHGMVRIEVVCKRCGAHLGHVFEGEGFKTPTDRRFCINGVALKFVEKGGAAPKLEPANSAEVQKKKEEVARQGGIDPAK